MPQSRTAIATSSSSRSRAHGDAAAGRGELHRVRDQVRQDLDQSITVAFECRHIGIDLALDRDVACSGIRAQAGHGLLDQRGGRHAGERELDLPELEARDVEQVVDQADQPVGVLQADVQELAVDR